MLIIRKITFLFVSIVRCLLTRGFFCCIFAAKKQNILVMDDVTTSGSTLNEILRVLRILNEDNDVTVFSLIGRKDLMADATF